ncbi:MAG: MFS transporter [Myxococcales bacterium]|nr:MFS transporter [Myxococcales bacterium]
MTGRRATSGEPPEVTARPWAVLGALGLLYAAQGVPFGFAAEYLPVLLRAEGASRTAIASLFWLQLPWQLKPLWAGAADRPSVRARARGLLLGLQLLLSLTMASYALFSGPSARAPWFVITAAAALVASTQDVFVDAFAVRSLSAQARGWGNSAQIAGYRVGIVVGGGGMLLLSGRYGTRATVLVCAALIAAASLGAFALRGEGDAPREGGHGGPSRAPSLGPTLRRMAGREVWPVAALALSFKLGVHMASPLIKPMLVDAGWSRDAIGGVVVTIGTLTSVVGSVCGGAVHRVLGERRALAVSAVIQGLSVLPLLWVARRGAPLGLTGFAVGAEHFASGLGTTVLFAALMTATRRDEAALHYTVLTSLNALAIGLAGLVGARVADMSSVGLALGLSAAVSLLPLVLLKRWDVHARASAGV